MSESLFGAFFYLRGYELGKCLAHESVPGFWDLARTLPLVNVELICLWLVLNFFKLFVFWILIWTWNFARPIDKLTHIIVACMAGKVFPQPFLIFLEILVYFPIILNSVGWPVRL